MSANYPERTLYSARQVIRNGVAELMHLTHGDLPEAWDMARTYAEEIIEACKVAHRELADYAVKRDLIPLGAGQQALRDIAAIPVATPEEEEIFTAYEEEARRVEAKRQQAAWDALSDEQKAEAESKLTEEAQKIEAAHPAVFDIASFAAASLGMPKGA